MLYYGEIQLFIEVNGFSDGSYTVKVDSSNTIHCATLEEAFQTVRGHASIQVNAQIEKLQIKADFEAAHEEAEAEFPGTSDDPKDILAMLDGE